jgi:hypothetical protein
MTEDLGSHHRDTLKRLFADPASGNIEWREVRSRSRPLAPRPKSRTERFITSGRCSSDSPLATRGEPRLLLTSSTQVEGLERAVGPSRLRFFK